MEVTRHGDRFESFPIDQHPRPVILLDDPIRIGRRGFVDGDAKQAWAIGEVDSTVSVPPGVMEIIRRDRYDVGEDVPPITITAVERIEHRFFCDRGRRRLPAFRLTVTKVFDPVVILDPALDIWWPAGGVPQARLSDSGTALMAADGVTLTVPAFGGFLTSFDGVEFDEHTTHVVARVITSKRPTTRSVIPLVGIGSQVTGRLREPLGGRVLLGENGQPLAVVPLDR